MFNIFDLNSVRVVCFLHMCGLLPTHRLGAFTALCVRACTHAVAGGCMGVCLCTSIVWKVCMVCCVCVVCVLCVCVCARPPAHVCVCGM